MRQFSYPKETKCEELELTQHVLDVKVPQPLVREKCYKAVAPVYLEGSAAVTPPVSQLNIAAGATACALALYGLYKCCFGTQDKTPAEKNLHQSPKKERKEKKHQGKKYR